MKKRISFNIALLRLLTVPIILLLLAYGKYDEALIFFIIISVVGFLDSYIARVRETRSVLRSLLGGFVDKLLIDSVAITLVIIGLLPLWVMVVYVGRDIITYVGGFILFWKDKITTYQPTFLGKIALFFQTIALGLAIFNIIDYGIIWVSVAVIIASTVYLLFKSEFIVLKKDKEFESFKMSKLLSIADIFTLGNVLFGFLVILFSINKTYYLASFMMFGAVLFDWIDGKVARAIKREGDFGKELDSLADTISFGVAPAIFGFNLIQTNLAIASFILFIFCGVLRLARYNISDMKGVYQGVPITLNGLIIPIVFFSGLGVVYYPYIYLVLGILMVSPIRINKVI